MIPKETTELQYNEGKVKLLFSIWIWWEWNGNKWDVGWVQYNHSWCKEVKNIKELKNSWEFEFSLSSINNLKNIKKLIVEKGSIAINGISLTIANVNEKSFNVSIIPHTFQHTNLSILKLNDLVNIEFDPLARYISEQYARWFIK